MLGWREAAVAMGWLTSGSVAVWHLVSAGSLWVGAVLAAAGLAPHVWSASQRLVTRDLGAEFAWAMSPSAPLEDRAAPQRA